uniref:Ig-like domain-containing protein n=1 Tax=Cyprinus carpio TaxID=7962 RepID=A0A8C1YEN1_CYPCA
MATCSAVVFCFNGKCNTQDSVNQPTRVQTASEHEMVELHCTYSTSDQYPYLYWYQHKTNGFPVYMLRKLSTGSSSSEKEFEERFHADLNKSSSSISSAAVSDSALYYCALQPTVTGNTRTLVTIRALFPGHVLARISILPKISR